MGIACGCFKENVMSILGKNYFYPDLPKGYQIISTTPICNGGVINVKDNGILRPLILLEYIWRKMPVKIFDLDPSIL